MQLLPCCKTNELKSDSLIPQFDGFHLRATGTPPGLQKYLEGATLQDSFWIVCKMLGLLPHNPSK